eukprot:SAG11_NODE_26275_length_347_cov_0.979839_1_plen_37_part_10
MQLPSTGTAAALYTSERCARNVNGLIPPVYTHRLVPS